MLSYLLLFTLSTVRLFESKDRPFIHRLLVVRFFSYGPTSVHVEGKRTHYCGMDEKGLGQDEKLSLSRPNLFSL